MDNVINVYYHMDTSSDSLDEGLSSNHKSQSFEFLPLPIDLFQPVYTGLRVVR